MFKTEDTLFFPEGAIQGRWSTNNQEINNIRKIQALERVELQT